MTRAPHCSTASRSSGVCRVLLDHVWYAVRSHRSEPVCAGTRMHHRLWQCVWYNLPTMRIFTIHLMSMFSPVHEKLKPDSDPNAYPNPSILLNPKPKPCRYTTRTRPRRAFYLKMSSTWLVLMYLMCGIATLGMLQRMATALRSTRSWRGCVLGKNSHRITFNGVLVHCLQGQF